ncbi:MAG: FMN-binding negative transcriptional regulator [Gemmatimonadota bacterium]
MYLPRSFREDDLATLHDMIRQESFGTLFSPGSATGGATGGDASRATHLPFVLHADRGERGTLVAHMARVNPHWKALRSDAEVLVTFLGPHTYISPSWYVSPAEVPTWNYQAVHVRGFPGVFDDPERLRRHVLELVDQYERGREQPWNPEVAAEVIERGLGAIVGFEIPIHRIEGKMKFNQNRSRADQEGVVRGLEASPHSGERAVAEIMRENLRRPPG